jgi:hypothetical protein
VFIVLGVAIAVPVAFTLASSGGEKTDKTATTDTKSKTDSHKPDVITMPQTQAPVQSAPTPASEAPTLQAQQPGELTPVESAPAQDKPATKRTVDAPKPAAPKPAPKKPAGKKSAECLLTGWWSGKSGWVHRKEQTQGEAKNANFRSECAKYENASCPVSKIENCSEGGVCLSVTAGAMRESLCPVSRKSRDAGQA